jgi:hypothetical protein
MRLNWWTTWREWLVVVLLVASPQVFAAGQRANVFISDDEFRALVAAKELAPVKGALARLAVDAASLANRNDLVKPYGGCDLDRVLRGFTYRFGGSADAAATLAQYAYFHHLDASYGTDELAKAATARARDILTGWAAVALLKDDGRPFAAEDFCSPQGKHDAATLYAVGLQLGRGGPPLAHAFDLLVGLDAFSTAERDAVIKLMERMRSVIVEASNKRAQRQNLVCNKFSNHVSVQLDGLISLTIATGDLVSLPDYVGRESRKLVVPWLAQIEKNIYGLRQAPLPCYKPDENPALYAQSDLAYAGEVNDRYRAEPDQTLHYVTLSLSHLLDSYHVLSRRNLADSEILDAARARLALAIQFYAPIVGDGISSERKTFATAASIPNARLYAGKTVSHGACQTINGNDDLLLPFTLGLASDVGAAHSASVVRKAMNIRSCPAPFSRLPAYHWGQLLAVRKAIK